MKRRLRSILRVIHLVVAAALGFLVYAPPTLGEPVRLFLAFVGIPLIALSGLFMYKPRLMPGYSKPRAQAGRGTS